MILGLLVLYLLSAIDLGISLAKHGEPRAGNHNIFITLIAQLMMLLLVWWITGWRFI